MICYLGHIEIEIMPCTPKGEGLGEDDFLDDPKELVMYTAKCCCDSNFHKTYLSDQSDVLQRL